jgi:hypothetical protein
LNILSTVQAYTVYYQKNNNDSFEKNSAISIPRDSFCSFIFFEIKIKGILVKGKY